MEKTLVVMAAGMGSRFGGLKQIEPVGPNGEFIIDYSIYDAKRAGFSKVVFVIKKELEEVFKDTIGKRVEDKIEVAYAFQEISDVPIEKKYLVEKREKPWGTIQAVLSAKNYVSGDFAVINADDFYGKNSFEVIAKELMRPRDKAGDYAMVGFRVGNTMTENGSVSRGVCENNDGMLTSVVERKAISYNQDHDIVFVDEKGEEQKLNPATPVSMNMWGFTPDYFDFAEREFIKFLKRDLNTPKAEQVIPDVADALIKSGETSIKVLDTDSKWFGVTYSEDRPGVMEKFAELHESGEYPENLFILADGE